jgi:hypothetical protein
LRDCAYSFVALLAPTPARSTHSLLSQLLAAIGKQALVPVCHRGVKLSFSWLMPTKPKGLGLKRACWATIMITETGLCLCLRKPIAQRAPVPE